MSTIFDVDLCHRFWGGLEVAKSAASMEAANTGAAVIAVDAVEIHPSCVTFIGTLPDLAVARTDVSFKPRRIGSFHTTWGSVLHPAGTIGFLVAGHPLNYLAYESNDPKVRRVAVSVNRTFTTIPTGNLGPICCTKCRQAISPKRLSAIPGVRVCLTCQTQREETVYGSKCSPGR
jgi:hypothetical protein